MGFFIDMKKNRIQKQEFDEISKSLETAKSAAISLSIDIPLFFGKTSRLGKKSVKAYDLISELKFIFEETSKIQFDEGADK